MTDNNIVIKTEPKTDITELIYDWNDEDIGGVNIDFETIEEAFNKWTEEYLYWNVSNLNTQEHLIIKPLYDKLESEWNNATRKRGKAFLHHYADDIDSEDWITDIENLYYWLEYRDGVKYNKGRISDKLDLIFYKQAERRFIYYIKRQDLDWDCWINYWNINKSNA